MCSGPAPDRRRHPRTGATWPVVVEAGEARLTLETLNLSPCGAKVRTTQHLDEGAVVLLHFQPPEFEPLDVSAVVWRVDPDGIVFFFVGVVR